MGGAAEFATLDQVGEKITIMMGALLKNRTHLGKRDDGGKNILKFLHLETLTASILKVFSN